MTQNVRNAIRASALWALAAVLFGQASAAEPEKLRALLGEEKRGANEAADSQARVNRLDDDTQKLLAEYRQVTAETLSMKTYNEQVASQVPSQTQEIESIERQLQEIETTQREVLPMMQEMLDTLDRFVELDVPFLIEERRNRVATLREMMKRADVTISEKYRRIVEAYQIEMDYGRTLEAYEARLGDGDQKRTVQFLKVGRIVLMYQTLDQKETGYWDADKKNWVVDNDYRSAFADNLAVAKKQGAPDLLIVPVPAPEQGKS
jgi:hypothetical protein